MIPVWSSLERLPRRRERFQLCLGVIGDTDHCHNDLFWDTSDKKVNATRRLRYRSELQKHKTNNYRTLSKSIKLTSVTIIDL